MIVAKLPWFAVQQYATVVLDGIGPRTVLEPMTSISVSSGVVLRDPRDDRAVTAYVNPNELVTVLIPETADALAALAGAGFTWEVIEQ